MVKIPKKMVLKNTKKCTAKNYTENPDQDPNKFDNAGSGSGSVYNVYGSATLVLTAHQDKDTLKAFSLN